MMPNSIATRRVALLIAALATVLPAAASADIASSLDLSARLDRTGSVPSLMRLAPAIELQTPRLRIYADAAGAAAGDRLWLRAARANAGLRLFRLTKLDGEFRATAVHSDPDDARSESAIRCSGRLVLPGRRSGLWIGAGNQASEPGASAPVLIGFGGWTRAGAFAISGGLEQTQQIRSSIFPAVAVGRVDSFVVGGVDVDERRTLRELLTTTHAHARLGWGRGPLEVETVAGLSLGMRLPPRRWAQTRVSLALLDQVALVATAGSTVPQWYSIDPSSERRASLGLRLTPSSTPRAAIAPPTLRPLATAWRVQRLERGRFAIRVRAAGARSVEIMSDVTGWEPVALERFHGDRWGVELEMTPGVHRVNLRLDGGPWCAPPGVAAAPDDFNGEVGLIVVE